MLDLLIRDGHVLSMDGQGTVYDPGSIAIRGDRIAAIGPSDLVSEPARRVIDAADCAVLPGFINSHMHECLLRGFCEDLPLDRWLSELCFPKDQAYRADHMHAAAMMNQVEMIRGGITTFIDIFRFPEQAALVAKQSGLRAIFSPQIIESVPGAGESLDQNEGFVAEWHGQEEGRIQAWFGPHAPFSVSADTFGKIVRLAEHYGVGIHTHLAETAWEVEECLRRFGQRPAHYLNGLGVLGPTTLAAHCVWLSEDEISLLADRGTAVAYNPSSNAKLASGVAPIPELLDAGVCVGLGTDSILSNNNLDMFEEMRLGAMLQKLNRKDAATMPCAQVLQMATQGSADALGLGAEIGSLEVGKKADIIVVDLKAAHLHPQFCGPNSNIVEQLVYSANAADVRTTIVDGRVLMDDRQVQTLDETEAFAAAQDAAKDLLQSAGLWHGRQKVH